MWLLVVCTFSWRCKNCCRSEYCCVFLSRQLCCGADCKSFWCAFTLKILIYEQKLTLATYHVTSCCAYVFLTLQKLLSSFGMLLCFLSRELCCGADCTSFWCAFTLKFLIYEQKLTLDTYHVTSCCACVFLALQNLLSFWLLMTSTRLALWRLSCFFGDHFVVILALVVFVLVVLLCKFCFGFSLTNYCVLFVYYVDNEICS